MMCMLGERNLEHQRKDRNENMTDSEKVQTIRMWINEAIKQGDRSVLVMAIKSILDLDDSILDLDDIEVQRGCVKLSAKSMEILKARKEIE